MSRPATTTRKSAKGDYIETDTGNKIARKSQIEGKQHIYLAGKSVVMPGAILRGDLCRKSKRTEGDKDTPSIAINIGKASVICTNTTLRPPMRISGGQMTFYPMKIGDSVFIGPDSHISAASIGNHVYVGANCVLSPFCQIKESCKVLPNTVVPPYMVVPPGSIVGGRPGQIIGEVGDGWGQGGGGEGEEWVEGGDLRPLVRSIK